MKSNRFTIEIFLVTILFMLPGFAIPAEIPEGLGGPPGMTGQKDDSREEPLPKGKELQDQKPPLPPIPPLYKPPRRGSPGGRVGGGTRGIKDELITLYVLAPDHVGLTAQPQPILYWYLSKLTQYPIEVTIIEDQAIYPILEKQVRIPSQPGIHPIPLADYNVRLLPGREYWWFVAVVPDPDRRSKDILAGGLIEFVKISEELRAKLAQGDKKETFQIYTEEGLWYDALRTISELIEAAPNDLLLRKQRASLLEQVRLSEIAAYDVRQETPKGK